MYFLKKAGLPNAHIVQAIAELLSFVSLISPSENIFLQAINSGFNDLKDAVQYYTAQQIKGIDYFLTSNTRDFKKASCNYQSLQPRNLSECTIEHSERKIFE